MKTMYHGVFWKRKSEQIKVPTTLKMMLRSRKVKYHEMYHTYSFRPVISKASCMRFSRSSRRRVVTEIREKAITKHK